MSVNYFIFLTILNTLFCFKLIKKILSYEWIEFSQPGWWPPPPLPHPLRALLPELAGSIAFPGSDAHRRSRPRSSHFSAAIHTGIEDGGRVMVWALGVRMALGAGGRDGPGSVPSSTRMA
jgi:hypothetical protein